MNKLVVVSSLALLLAACSAPPPPPAVPKLVRTMNVGAGGTASEASRRAYSGEVRARIETTLGFRVGGKLVARLVDAGTSVKPGQPLARLDPTDTGLQAAQAEAQRALAEADLKRYQDLKARNFISASALDARETAFKAADAQAKLAKNQAAYTTLVADKAGVIGQVLAEPGQVVGAGQAVFRMAPDSDREIAINVPENEISGFKPGQAADVTLWAGSVGIAGTVREIMPVADPVTRTYAVRVSLKDADPRLPLGMSASVRFPNPAAVAAKPVVPLGAIFQQGNQAAVWLVGADDTVRLKPIVVSAYSDAGAVVAEGLAGGERIVAIGANRLSAGEKVRVAVGSGRQ
jgi:membrane fusion protein, multidrug efflux system